MKKSGWTLLLFVILGLLAGALLSHWLESVPGTAFLTKPIEATISPAIDLYVLDFAMNLDIRISLLSIIGAVIAIWLYRKL
ncbi:DUF4321 domain-containing protein [Paenibacillus sp. J5C_2022]|uniref:DUF4321 domain-containing protein n=1 Tax=Paenibacillus sp. J5C2022 TaxID=2977129 RepID=UPI0021D06E0B|nr:DUF4321 domain-containing protein [Paenibacillus sp. J5C2022]MCU6711088.1 DUF4321 domain-containing protein [Paenibacillus sp. J5C2022]